MTEETRLRKAWRRLQTSSAAQRAALMGILLVASYLTLMVLVALDQPTGPPRTDGERLRSDVDTLIGFILVLGPVWFASSVPAMHPRIAWPASLGIGLVAYLAVGVLLLVLASLMGITSGLPLHLAVPLAPVWPAVLWARVGCFLPVFPCWEFPN